MIKIMDIEKAISNLPHNQLAQFRSWFEKFDNEKWDRELEEDVKAGKFTALGKEALEDFKNGKCKEL